MDEWANVRMDGWTNLRIHESLLLGPVIPSGAQRNRGISRLRGARSLDSTVLRFVPPRPVQGKLLETAGGPGSVNCPVPVIVFLKVRTVDGRRWAGGKRRDIDRANREDWQVRIIDGGR